MSSRIAKGRKRRSKQPTEDKTQSERFVRAAKALGLDPSGKAFERAMDTLVPRKPK
jgi:hypothetical protein